ncbi:hypothetical protein LINGRAPRIM_LOCUS609, partial [Linum grandiflorum]
DVIGCLVSITDHVAASDGHLAFTIVIDDPGCFCLSIKYTHFVPPAGFDLHHIASAEAVRPILCILTAVVPRMSIDDFAVLGNTGASRIIFVPFMQPYRSTFTVFSHNHVPVRLIGPRSPHCYAFVRGNLPRKVPLSVMVLQHHVMPPEVNERVWCLVRIVKIDGHADNITYTDGSPRYTVAVRCSDATVCADFLFPSPAADLLLQMTPAEYVAQTSENEQALCHSLRDRFS